MPVGCNGNLIVEFRDYLVFITKVAGVKATYALEDISERIMGELSPIIAECILGSDRAIGLNSLIGLQANSRSLGKKLAEELDKELADFGLGVRDINILSINYPAEVQAMAEKVAAQSFVGNVGKYAAVSMADSFGNENGGGVGAMGAQLGMGVQMAQQMMGAMAPNMVQPAQAAPATPPEPATTAGDRLCPTCRKMVSSKFCPECGTPTV